MQALALLILCGRSSEVAALPPTVNQLRMATAARNVRVHVYDPASAGVMPPASSFSAGGAACKDTCVRQRNINGFLDLCNNGYGRAAESQFAAAHQGRLWLNHDWGHDVALQVCVLEPARLMLCASCAKTRTRNCCAVHH